MLENQYLPGGGGSNGSLIPTIRAPAGLQASEQNGSGWPREAAFLLQKEVPLCPEQQQGRLLLPLVGVCSGTGTPWAPVPPDFSLRAPGQVLWGSLLQTLLTWQGM